MITNTTMLILIVLAGSVCTTAGFFGSRCFWCWLPWLPMSWLATYSGACVASRKRLQPTHPDD